MDDAPAAIKCIPLMLAAFTSSGCEAVNDSTPRVERVARAEQTLAYWQGQTLWTNGVVPTCFRKGPGPCARRCSNNASCTNNADCGGATCNTATTCENGNSCSGIDSDGKSMDCQPASDVYTRARDQIISALTQTWSASSSVTFDVRGDCQANPEASLMVLTLDNTGGQGVCGIGAGADCTIGIRLAGRIPDVAVHEVGHALGLPHEHQRNDSDRDPADARRMAACKLCNKDARTCSYTNYVVCFAPFPDRVAAAQSPTSTLTDADLSELRWLEANSMSFDGALYLTAYDRKSIMNYWNERVYDDLDPAKSDWALTPLDRLGIEILYPRSRSLSLACSAGCTMTSAGIVARSDAALIDEWTHGSAKPWWTDAGFTWMKYVFSSTGPVGVGYLGVTTPSLPTRVLGSGGAFAFSAKNKWNNKDITGAAMVEVNDSKWTALVMASI